MALAQSYDIADEIITLVCNVSGLSKSELLGRDGHNEYAVPRALSVYMTYTYTLLTYAEIGRLYDNRTHPSLLSMIETGRVYVMQQPHITHIYNGLVKKLKDKFELGDFQGYVFPEERHAAREAELRRGE